MFWENGVPEMPEMPDNNAPTEQGEASLTRPRVHSYDVLLEELEEKESELKMAAEIGLQLYEKSEASSKRCEELNIQVRDLNNRLIELEMENEGLLRQKIAQRQRQKNISQENLKLSSDIGQVHALRSELEDARADIDRLELICKEKPRSPSRRNSRRLSYYRSDSSSPKNNKDTGAKGAVLSQEELVANAVASNDAGHNDSSKMLELECQIEQLEAELTTAQEKSKALQVQTTSSQQRVLDLDSAAKQTRSDLDELRIEIDVSRNSRRQLMNESAHLKEQLHEDQDIITLLRSRVKELADELGAVGNSTGVDSRSRYSSRADVILDEVRELREVQDSNEATNIVQDQRNSIAADPELQDRLVAKLQESTTQLMHAQTELNSAENELQHYKRQYANWIKSKKPEFHVEGCIDHERGHALYTIILLQNKEEQLHSIDQRYSEVAHFRAELKRTLFLDNHLGSIRLPALPPKVWGNFRSQSALVVEQRTTGIKEFLNVMLALSELSVSIRTPFFDWIGWNPNATTTVNTIEEGKT